MRWGGQVCAEPQGAPACPCLSRGTFQAEPARTTLVDVKVRGKLGLVVLFTNAAPQALCAAGSSGVSWCSSPRGPETLRKREEEIWG